jgi:hypothetical protein
MLTHRDLHFYLYKKILLTFYGDYDILKLLNKYVDTIEFRGDKKRVEHFLRELYTEAINL